jgi:hypothetical protein
MVKNMENKRSNTLFIKCIGDNETILFAGHELAKYIQKMDTSKTVLVEITQACEYKEETTIWLGLNEHITVHGLNIEIKDSLTDCIYIDIMQSAGIILGVNPRSVLLGVYQFLTQAGCRWIRPGEDGEIIPEKCFEGIEVHSEKEASYKHRGVCIEGANSLENVLDMVDWLPKIGCNSYFIQFRESFTFFERWYTHKYNPFMEQGKFTIENARALVEIIIKEIKKRGLVYHAVGHGWTCEPFGLEGTGWDPKEYDLSPEITKNFALVNGKREVWQGIPINTNLCYSDDAVRDIVIKDIVGYLEKHKEVDLLHFWLADGFNNHCECENCVKFSPSDIYVKMLNELDKQLSEKGINTKIVFLIYFELLWPPQTEKIQNEDRFILMFAPISRTYSQPYATEVEMGELPPYIRNNITLPKGIEENMSFLYAWEKQFKGDSFDFDYHLYYDHYNDPGNYAVSKILYTDIKNLKSMGLNGLISCQVQRVFLPTAFPTYVIGKTLWDDSIEFEELAKDYFIHAFGEDGMLCKEYLSQLSAAFNPPYMRDEIEQISKEAAEEFSKIPDIIQEFSEIIKKNLHHQEENIAKSWSYMEYHSKICRMLASILACKAKDDKEKMLNQWALLKEYVLKNEADFQEAFDVQMFISTLNSKFE